MEGAHTAIMGPKCNTLSPVTQLQILSVRAGGLRLRIDKLTNCTWPMELISAAILVTQLVQLKMADWVGKARTKRCDLGILNRADGSARFQQGVHTSHLCG